MAYIDPNEYPQGITLDTVTPYIPPKTYIPPEPDESTPQFTPAPVPAVAPYTAPEVYAPAKEATVESRMGGLLSSGSPYMKAARGRGMSLANDRGLLNTSMAAEASEKAAIESAFPVASQDAAAFQEAGMAGYQGKITGALSEQKYGHDVGIIETQAEASSQLSAQDASQKASQIAYDAAVKSGLSSQEASQKASLAAYQTALESGLSEQEARQVAALSTQEAGQKMEWEAVLQEGANHRQQMELSLKETLAVIDLSSKERTSAGTTMADLGNEFMAQLANIQRDPNVTGTAKTGAIKTLQDAYMANIESLSSVYGMTINWAPIV